MKELSPSWNPWDLEGRRQLTLRATWLCPDNTPMQLIGRTAEKVQAPGGVTRLLNTSPAAKRPRSVAPTLSVV